LAEIFTENVDMRIIDEKIEKNVIGWIFW
jgi:hypothetical protein